METGFGVGSVPKAIDYQGINASVVEFDSIKDGEYNGKKANILSRVCRYCGETGSSVVDNVCRLGRSIRDFAVTLL